MSENQNLDQSNDQNVKLGPPWTTYGGFIKRMFRDDPDITLDTSEVDEDNGEAEKTIYINVKNSSKAYALRLLMIPEVDMGNITLKVQVNDVSEKSDAITADTLRAAFSNNPIVDDVKEVPWPSGEMVTYCVFRYEPFQFFNDNIADLYGNFNGLAEDVAKELFQQQAGINWCTNKGIVDEKDEG